ncbi:MAG: FKBP-type peptidyl-prolyl cis-trans isomerase [Bacteroidales bacterium]|nr:FKBP-type peptidyl-prolyl cis-trans isomerase [Bacteroidales bacterium]
MRRKNFLLFSISFLLFAVACDRIVDDPIGDEMARLQAWLQVNKITTTPTASGLYFIDIKDGNGLAPKDSNYVVLSYEVRDLDGNLYETTNKDVAKLYDIFAATKHYVPSYTQYLSKVSVLKGLVEALSMMKEGGKARLIMPSKLAYGAGASGIPSYKTLIYDVELKKIVADPKAYEKDSISRYLSHHPGYTSFNDSLYYKKTVEGTRQCIVANDSVVQVYYVGRFLDGFVFDTNIDTVALKNNIYSTSKTYETLNFTVGSDSYAPGFNLAVKKMIEGEWATFVIPSFNMYGAEGQSSGTTPIPPYATLIFDIKLVKVDPK